MRLRCRAYVSVPNGISGRGIKVNGKELIARRIARELKDGFYVNLGIGLPTTIAACVPP